MSVTSRPHGVVFDMGDILYDATAWRRWLADRLASSGIDIDYPRLVQGWEAALVPVYRGEQPYWSAFEGFLANVGVSTSDIPGLREEASLQGKALSEKHAPFPGVAEELGRMKSHGLRLAVLSDNEAPASKVRSKLRRFGIDDFFDEVLTSCDIGAVKPTAEAFQSAVDALGLTTETTAFVAHDLDELEGSLEFGLHTVAFNYEGNVPADVHAATFAEVTDAVIEWSSRSEE